MPQPIIFNRIQWQEVRFGIQVSDQVFEGSSAANRDDDGQLFVINRYEERRFTYFGRVVRVNELTVGRLKHLFEGCFIAMATVVSVSCELEITLAHILWTPTATEGTAFGSRHDSYWPSVAG